MNTRATGRYLHLPKGDTTIRILDPAPTHDMTFTVEELARYRAITYDCPLCDAGIPLTAVGRKVSPR